MTLEEAIARCEKIVKEAKKSYEVPVADGIMAEVGMELTKKGIEEYQQYTEWLKELAERRKQPEIIHCGECVYYDPPHVENNGMRYEYSEMPKEAFDVLGTGLVSVEYGINVGGRCCVDYYCKNYPDDKRVYVPKDNYCGRAERRTDE